MIRAEEIEARILEKDKELITNGEKRIDDALEAEWQPGGEVDVGLDAEYPSRVVNQLATMYRQNGWEVTVGKQHAGSLRLNIKKRVSASSFYDK